MGIGALVRDELARSVPQRDAMRSASPDDRTSSALDALVRYIPTETVTLYIVAVSATKALVEELPWVTEWRLYAFFLAATPVIFLLVYAGDRRSAGLSALPPLREWPWWKLFASSVAFAVWGIAVPGHPWNTDAKRGVVAGVLAVVVSTALTLVGRIVEPTRS